MLALIPAGFVSDELFIQFEARCVRNPMKWTKRRTSSKHVEVLVGDCLVLCVLQLLWKASVSGSLQTANSMKQIIIIPNGSNNYGTGWTQYKVGCLWLRWGSQCFTHSFYKNLFLSLSLSPLLCLSLSHPPPSLRLSVSLSLSFPHTNTDTHIFAKRDLDKLTPLVSYEVLDYRVKLNKQQLSTQWGCIGTCLVIDTSLIFLLVKSFKLSPIPDLWPEPWSNGRHK